MFKNLNPSALGVSGHQSELIELAVTFGFAGMDICITEFAVRARLKGMPYARRLLDSAKLRVGTFALPFDLETDEDNFRKELKKLPEIADCAAQLGCTRCTTLLAPAGDALPYHENFEFHRRRIHEVCEALRPSGVWLGLAFQALESLQKNHAFQFIHDLDATVLLMNMVGAANLGLVLDTWDIVAGGGSIESIRKIPAPQVVAVQLADMPAGVAPAELDDKSRLLPGGENGQIDVAGFLAELRKLGYDGPVTAKPSRTAFQSRRRDVIIKQTSEALERVLHPTAAPVVAQPVMATV